MPVSPLFSDDTAQYVREVTAAKGGALLVRVEYYHDLVWTAPTEIKRKAGTGIKDMIPDAYERFLSRIAQFQAEQSQWKTVVVDSVTSMGIAARRWDQFVLNPQAEDARQWYGTEKDLLERMLLGRMSALPQNVVVLAHIDDEKYESHGTSRRMPMAPGKLRGTLPSQYQEVYHAFVDKDSEHWLHTRSNTLWACTTQIQAPNPCEPHYAYLWANYTGPKMPIHVLVYGDFGAGKSTFAATFPKPMIVFSFDAYGKDMPYYAGA